MTPPDSEKKVEEYLGRLSAHYKPKSVRERARMVAYILDNTRLRYVEVAQQIHCSPSHIFQLNYLAKNLSEDELHAIDELGITVSKAYRKYTKTI